MNASDVMASNVITVSPETTVRAVAALLFEKRISGVPVVGGDGTLVGIVSEGDLLRRFEIDTDKPTRSWWPAWLASSRAMAATFIKTHSRSVRDVMTRQVIVAAPDTPLREIAVMLERNHIKRIPIIDDGALIGLVSRADLVRALACSEQDVAPRDDAALNDAITACLAIEPWASTAYINITVRSGVVEVNGMVETEIQRDAVIVAIEIIPGVVAVIDRMRMRPVSAET